MILRILLIIPLYFFVSYLSTATIQVDQAKIDIEELVTTEAARQNESLLQDQIIIRQEQIIVISWVFLVLFILTVALFWFKYYIKNKKMISVLRELNDQISDQKNKILKQKEDLDEAHEVIVQANQSLEKQIQERTKKLVAQHEKLKEYSFSNSHLVRSPLSRILGISNLLKAGDLTDSEQKEFINNLQVSAKELDDIIINLNVVLSEQEAHHETN